jgi:hypothetical protein
MKESPINTEDSAESRTEGSLHGVVKPQCACAHHDGYECARIRDGRHMPDDDDCHKRCCECDCNETEDFYEE